MFEMGILNIKVGLMWFILIEYVFKLIKNKGFE